jgi:DnaJ-class molecular chaperone
MTTAEATTSVAVVEACPECRGLGWIPVYKYEPDGNLYTLAPNCPVCHGRGVTPAERRGTITE